MPVATSPRAARSSAAPKRIVRVAEIMGTAMSVHVLTRTETPRDATERAIEACFTELRDLDRVFSTYRQDSDILRIASGALRLADADPRVADVEAACRAAAIETGGLFSAMWAGWFDPTGFVKGWAVESAARRHLAPLVAHEVAVGLTAGGDMQLFTAPDEDWRWRIGIADPHRPGAVIATVEVADGAVATSGSAERGHHIIDPRTGDPARGTASATFVADGLAHADIWATAAVVAGFDDRSWMPRSGTRTGLLVADDGRVARWIDGVTVDVVGASSAL